MDKRIEKTKLAIKNAFMELRAKKTLEKSQLKNYVNLRISTNLLSTHIMKTFMRYQMP